MRSLRRDRRMRYRAPRRARGALYGRRAGGRARRAGRPRSGGASPVTGHNGQLWSRSRPPEPEPERHNRPPALGDGQRAWRPRDTPARPAAARWDAPPAGVGPSPRGPAGPPAERWGLPPDADPPPEGPDGPPAGRWGSPPDADPPPEGPDGPPAGRWGSPPADADLPPGGPAGRGTGRWGSAPADADLPPGGPAGR